LIGTLLLETVPSLGPRRLLHTVYYVTDLRAVDEFRADTSQISTEELELATLLVRAMSGTFAPARGSRA